MRYSRSRRPSIRAFPVISLIVTTAALLATSPVLADGHADIDSGAKVIKKCQACHVVRAPDGTILAGKSSKTGPNLWGIVGRQAGTLDGFRSKKSRVAAGVAGLIWIEEQVVTYVQDPTGFLRDYLDDKKRPARG